MSPRVTNDSEEFSASLATDPAGFEPYFAPLRIHSAVLLVVHAASGRIAAANKAAERFYGYTASQFSALTIYDINQLSRQAISEEMARAAREDRNVFVFPHRLANGELRTVEVHSSPFPTPGAPWLLSHIHDVTGRVETEKKLRESEARWQYALEGAQDGVWDWHIPANRVYFSPQWKALLGLEQDEIGQTLDEWDIRIHPDDKAHFYYDLARHFREETDYYENEHRLLHKGGGYRWMLGRGKVFERDAAGRPTRVIGTISDITARKRAEQQLREANERFSQLLAAASGVAIIATNTAHIITLFNSGAENLLGYAAEEVVGLKTPEIFHVREEVEECAGEYSIRLGEAIDPTEALATLAQRGVRDDREWTFIRKDGRRRTVHHSVTALRGADAEVTGYLGVAIDVTERKQSKEQLIATQQRLNALLDANPVVIFTMQPDKLDDISFVGTNVRDITGFEREHIQYEKGLFASRLDPSQAKENRRKITQWLAGGARDRLVLQYRFRRADERWIWLEERIVAVRNREGDLVELVGATADVTAQYDSTRRMDRISRHIPGVIYQFRLRPDGTSHFPYASEGMRDIYACSPDDVIEDATPVFDRLHPDDFERINAAIAVSAESLEPWRCEYRVVHPDGKVMWLEGLATPEREGDGSTLWYGYTTEITARKRAEEERVALERHVLYAQKLESLGVIASGIAHDFNNLLMAVLGNLDMVAVRMAPQDVARVNVDDAMAAARRAADLTRQMLLYSGGAAFMVQRFDLNEFVRSNTSMMETAVGKGVGLQIQFGAEPLTIQADKGQILQVLMNLITNASEAIGDDSGTVAVSTGQSFFDEARLEQNRLEDTAAPGTYGYLKVADTGSGMDSTTLERIFDPFYTTKFIGRGLGMSAVLGIVRAHHGAIFIESAIDEGTEITVLFPLASTEETGLQVDEDDGSRRPCDV